MSYAEDENYDGYDLEVDAENDSLQHALTDAIKKLAKAQAEILRLKAKAQAALAEAVAKERERCAKVCEEMANSRYQLKESIEIMLACADAIRKGE
jgi:hypothetical protein